MRLWDPGGPWQRRQIWELIMRGEAQRVLTSYPLDRRVGASRAQQGQGQQEPSAIQAVVLWAWDRAGWGVHDRPAQGRPRPVVDEQRARQQGQTSAALLGGAGQSRRTGQTPPLPSRPRLLHQGERGRLSWLLKP